jgi:hypothetical protein
MLGVGLMVMLAWPGLAKEESEKIEALIAHVESLKDAKFIRNGSTYEAPTAAKLMRYKWNKSKDQIKTGRDFIRICATASTTTGQAYMIRFKDGKEVRSGEYLLEQLEKIEKE